MRLIQEEVEIKAETEDGVTEGENLRQTDPRIRMLPTQDRYGEAGADEAKTLGVALFPVAGHLD